MESLREENRLLAEEIGALVKKLGTGGRSIKVT
jgi:hypothetical protein